MSMDWLNDDIEETINKVSFPKKSEKVKIKDSHINKTQTTHKPKVPQVDKARVEILRTQAESPSILCPSNATGLKTTQLYMRVPPDVVARLKRLTEGAFSVAGWCLIDEALREIEKNKEQVIIKVKTQEI